MSTSTGSSSPARVVVLGHTGFLGGALAADLDREGAVILGYSSRDLDLTSPASAAALAAGLDARTALVVTAAVRAPGDRVESFEGDLAIAGTVARALALGTPLTCVYLSSASVYGDRTSDLAIDEGTAVAPTSYYGRAKAAAETLLRRAAEAARVPLVVLRPCRVYGPGDAGATYGPSRFLRSILETGTVTLYGDGRELRDHVFVGDAVRVVRRCLRGDLAGTFNVASGQSRSYLEIVEAARAVVPSSFEVLSVARSRPRIDQRFDIRRLRAAIPGFVPTDLERGLRETYAALGADIGKERLACGK